MKYISRLLWLLPFILHMVYVEATYRYFFGEVGQQDGNQISTVEFLWQWLPTVITANVALAGVQMLLPRFSDKLLSVPNKEYWLANSERRQQLISRLRGLVEVDQFAINIFFAGVYQMIYQTNVIRPLLVFPIDVLLIGFVAGPIVATMTHMGFFLKGLSKPE